MTEKTVWRFLWTLSLLTVAFRMSAQGMARTSGGGTGEEAFRRMPFAAAEAASGQQKEVFVKVTNVSELRDGLRVIIVNEERTKAMGEQKTDNFGATTMELNKQTTPYQVSFSEGVTVATLETAGSNWYLKTDKGYLRAASSNQNQLKTQDEPDKYSEAKITIATNNNAVIAFQGGNSHYLLRYNSSSTLFSCYSGINTTMPIQLYREKETTEVVSMKNSGFATYVTRNAIDWKQTMERNTTDGVASVRGYKVTEFTKESAVFAEFGKGDNEQIIPAGTPIILRGMAGDNVLVVAAEPADEGVTDNQLKASGGLTVTEEQHLLVFQKTPDWTEDDPFNNYAFYKVAAGRTIPAGKAYLDGDNVATKLKQTTNAAKGIFLLEDLLAAGGGGTATTIDELPGGPVPAGPAGTYDLSGRPQTVTAGRTLPKGIYIVDGRKVMAR